jgi:hypothetical protein
MDSWPIRKINALRNPEKFSSVRADSTALVYFTTLKIFRLYGEVVLQILPIPPIPKRMMTPISPVLERDFWTESATGNSLSDEEGLYWH